MTFVARIRRVRMKDGADVHVLHNALPDDNDGTPENWTGRIVTTARKVSEYNKRGSRLDGYIVIGMFEDGGTSIGFRIPQRIPACLVPAYVAELMRRDAVTEREAERVFDDRFEWRDG